MARGGFKRPTTVKPLVWLVLGAIPLVILCVHELRSTSSQAQTDLARRLFPFRGPTRPCGSCLSTPRLCELYGSKNLQRSRLYDGSGDRIRRMLRKAQKGEGLSIGLLGGSISVGHGCDDGSPLWHDYLKAWFEGRFGGRITLANAAVPATGSELFKFCHAAMVPSDADLILLDVAVNDYLADDATFDNKESLVRSLLLYESRPALLALDFFKIDNMIRTGADGGLGLSNYYDFPTISMRPVMLPKMLLDREWRTQWYRGPLDPHHPSCQGHRVAADFVIGYLEDQLCQMDQPEYNVPPKEVPYVPSYTEEDSLSIPRLRLHGPGPLHDADSFDAPLSASCKFLHGNFTEPLEPIESKGFEVWTMTGGKRYWRGRGVGSYITFALDPSKPKAYLYFLRTNQANLRPASVRCTRGDRSTLIDGYHPFPISVGRETELLVRSGEGAKVEPKVTCTVVSETTSPHEADSFYIIGLIEV